MVLGGIQILVGMCFLAVYCVCKNLFWHDEFYSFMHSVNVVEEVLSARTSKSSINNLVITGDIGDPIGASYICLYRWLSYKKYVFLMQCWASLTICASGLYFLLIIAGASVVGTSVKRDVTSKLTNFFSVSIVCALRISVKGSTFLTYKAVCTTCFCKSLSRYRPSWSTGNPQIYSLWYLHHFSSGMICFCVLFDYFFTEPTPKKYLKFEWKQFFLFVNNFDQILYINN